MAPKPSLNVLFYAVIYQVFRGLGIELRGRELASLCKVLGSIPSTTEERSEIYTNI
jgi:hypothetical protein